MRLLVDPFVYRLSVDFWTELPYMTWEPPPFAVILIRRNKWHDHTSPILQVTTVHLCSFVAISFRTVSFLAASSSMWDQQWSTAMTIATVVSKDCKDGLKPPSSCLKRFFEALLNFVQIRSVNFWLHIHTFTLGALGNSTGVIFVLQTEDSAEERTGAARVFPWIVFRCL